MSKTYERILGKLGVIEVNGHAYSNALNIKSVAIANIDIKKELLRLKINEL